MCAAHGTYPDILLRDILYELASVGDLPLPQVSPGPSNKRERDSDSPVSSGAVSIASDSPGSGMVTDTFRTFAGSRRVTKELESANLKDGPSLAAATFAQPLPRSRSARPGHSSESEKQVANGGGATTTPSFALPVHTDELGRLPLHPGFNVSYSGEWQHEAQPPPPSQAPQPQAHGGGAPPFDPRVMGMYALQPPSFNELFSAAMQEPSAFTQAGPDVSMGATGGAPPATGPQGPSLSSEEMAFADNTLAMWSNAPSSFE